MFTLCASLHAVQDCGECAESRSGCGVRRIFLPDDPSPASSSSAGFGGVFVFIRGRLAFLAKLVNQQFSVHVKDLRVRVISRRDAMLAALKTMRV
jgi:hypothetical protein